MITEDRELFAKSILTEMYDLRDIKVMPESALPGVISEIEELLSLNSPDTLRDRCAYFQIPNTTENDYEEKLYEIRPGCTVLAGIRHLSGSKDQPFVQVLFGFTPSLNDFSLIKEFARETFGVFSPKNVSAWLRPSSSMALELEKAGFAARRYIVGRLSDIAKLPSPRGQDRIKLEKIEGAFDYHGYEMAYEQFHQEKPELKKWVPLTEKEELQKCADEGLLFRVVVDEVHAGLIAARSEPLLGCPAVYMTELLINHPFKGQGLAPALQRKFLDSLPRTFELVWGTIDAKNKPSTQTALRVGRIPIRSEYFLPLK